MDYKEKYEMALEGIQEILGSGEESIKISRLQLRLQGIFPELKENKAENADEKVRKALIKLVTDHASMDLFIEYDIHLDEALSWLKKQVELKKPSEWDLKDERAASLIRDAINGMKLTDEARCIVSNWINSLKDRIQVRLKRWSEEDSRILYNVKSYIGYAIGQRGYTDELFKEANEWLNSLPIGFIYNKNYNEDMITLLIAELEQIAKYNNAPLQYQAEINWLKSLRPQKKWKPTEKQLKYLYKYAEQNNYDGAILTSLYNDLKQL